MTDKPKEEDRTCTDCGHFILKQTSVTVDVTGTDLVARAKYVCDKGLEPNFIDYCPNFYAAVIEDAITWKRGWVDEDD
jgi:hypothetical protein